MRYLPLLFAIALAAIPVDASAQGAVILVVDALGSSYLAPHTATYTSGAAIPPVGLGSFDRASARYQLKVPVPSTEYGHAVIVTGYSNASQPTVAYYHSTVFDVLKDDGYLALGIMENGDTHEMMGKLDAIVHNKNGSVARPDFDFVKNDPDLPADIERMMRNYSGTPPDRAGKGAAEPCINYNAWGLGFTRDLVQYMGTYHPGLDYVLIVNIGGLDESGHNLGYGGYRAVLSGLDGDLGGLIDACAASDTILMITGDHGMSFKNETAKGSHASPAVAARNESLLVPLLIYSNKTAGGGGVYGQECLAPTLLSMLDEPDTLSMGDGEPLPVKEKPALYLRSKRPVSVAVTGGGLSLSKTVNGTERVGDLEKRDYTISYGGIRKNIYLAHDLLLDVGDGGPGPAHGDPWMIYLAAAGVSIAGIGTALRMAWMKK